MTFRLKRSGAILAFVLLLFFAPVFAALLDQTIWQRLLGFFSGVGVYSVTITVAAFRSGLGCGSFTGGRLADHLSPRHCLEDSRIQWSFSDGLASILRSGKQFDVIEFRRYSPDTERETKRDLNSDLLPRDECMVPPQP